VVPHADKYTIKSGDTLLALAQSWGTTVNALMEMNPGIVNPDVVFAGQIINRPLPASKPASDRHSYLVSLPSAA
jgi:LysM repeat protein